MFSLSCAGWHQFTWFDAWFESLPSDCPLNSLISSAGGGEEEEEEKVWRQHVDQLVSADWLELGWSSLYILELTVRATRQCQCCCSIRLIFPSPFFILIKLKSTFVLDILVKQIVGGWVVLCWVVSHAGSDMLRCWAALTVTQYNKWPAGSSVADLAW